MASSHASGEVARKAEERKEQVYESLPARATSSCQWLLRNLGTFGLHSLQRYRRILGIGGNCLMFCRGSFLLCFNDMFAFCFLCFV